MLPLSDFEDFFEPKKRRFHPLRGLRKIFRRKSRGAADVRVVVGQNEREVELARVQREDVTDRHPAGGRPEETARSRSASELLTDHSDRESVFLRNSGAEDSFTKLRGGTGKLSVSHDSVFPGEVPHTRPLASLASLATLERRQARNSSEIEHKEYNQHVVQRHRISLRVLEQIKTVIENRNQLASATSTETTSITHSRSVGFEKQDRSGEQQDSPTRKAKIEEKLSEPIRSTYRIEDRSRSSLEIKQKISVAKRESARREDTIEKERGAEERVKLVKGSPKTEERVRSRQDSRRRIPPPAKREEEVVGAEAGRASSKEIIQDQPVPHSKEDLPELESASLNHTAALHRISVRPKNRRPPRRTATPQTANTSGSSITTIVEDTVDNAEDQPEQQQEPTTSSNPNSNTSSPTESKVVSVTRKSSSRLSRNSDIFEELECLLPRKPSSLASLSPDSLDVNATSRTSVDTSEEHPEIRTVTRRPSSRVSKGSDIFEELEAKLPRSRRSSSNRLSKSPDSLDASWFSKSTEGFEKLAEYEQAKPVARRLLNPISKSSERVSKSSDSLEAIEVLTSDESIERRRSSFEFRARRSSKNISKSSESFEALEQQQMHSADAVVQELQKRNSASDINLARGRRLSKSISKSSESFERTEISEAKDEEEEADADSIGGQCCGRSSKRMSSESSDNLELEDRLENRRIRRIPKRISNSNLVDIMATDDHEEEKRQIPVRKPSRLQKSSESSELGSTDTLDSERRNKSSESTETLDSLERDLEQDRKQEEFTESVIERREKNDSWSNRNLLTTDSDEASMPDGTDDSKSLTSPEKYYWRQTSESKENLDIHQLLAFTIVTRMTDNGNSQRSSVIYPKKKQSITGSQPTSPVAKQEDNKMLFDNLIVTKNDEDLQNMLNGNISEVSTDTKSFKEKLIMFEKLGK